MKSKLAKRLVAAAFIATCMIQAGAKTEAIQEDGGLLYNTTVQTIENGNYQKGEASRFGGAVYNSGQLTFNGNTSFKWNEAGAQGGGLYSNGGTVDFNGNVSFEQNKGHAIGGLGVVGNSVVNMTKEGSTIIFDNNIVTDTERGCGGAVLVQDSTLNIGNNAQFTSNVGGILGGAIYQKSSDNPNHRETSTTIGSGALFHGNMAQGSGAIYNYASTDASTITIGNNAKFITNSTTAGSGGAIGNFGGQDPMGGKITIGANSQFSANFAKVSGGAIYNASDMTLGDSAKFNNNIAGLSGGAIYNEGKMVIGTGSQFVSNAISTTDIDQSYGGAIYNTGSLEIGNGALFEGNSAGRGGAIFNWTDGDPLTIGDNATFKYNTATVGPGGAIHARNGFSIGNNATFEGNRAVNGAKSWGGGAIYIALEKTASSTDPQTFKVTIGDNATFSSNIADLDKNGSRGGAILAESARDGVQIGANSQFNDNRAQAGGAIWNQVEMKIGDNASFKSNEATKTFGGAYGGGAIANFNKLTFEGTSSFTENRNGGGFGGAIHNAGQMDFGGNSVFIGNDSATDDGYGQGGAIYNQGTMTFNGTSGFKENMTGSAGGAIYNEGGTITFKEDAAFIKNGVVNESVGQGGAIYNTNATGGTPSGSMIFEKNAYFEENAAVTGSGGAIYNVANMTIKGDAGFVKNTSGMNGGAISNNGGHEINFEGGAVFEGNTAAQKGGAIYNDGTINFKASNKDIVFKDNKTNGKANDIFMSTDSVLNIDGVRTVYMNGGFASFNNNSATINNSSNLVLGGDSSGYKGVYNQTSGVTDVNGGYFGGESNLSGKNTITNFNDGSKLASGAEVNLSSGAIVNIADGFISELGSKIDTGVDGNLNFNNQQNIDLNAQIAGSGNIFKKENGNVYLYADNSGFTGLTKVSGIGRFEVKDGGKMLGGKMEYQEGSVTEIVSDNVPIQDLNNSVVIITPTENGSGLSFDDKVIGNNSSVLIAGSKHGGDIDFHGTVEQNGNSTLVANSDGADINFKENVTIDTSNLVTNGNKTNFEKSITLSKGYFKVSQGGFNVTENMTVGSTVDLMNGAISENNIGGDLLIGVSGKANFGIDFDTRAKTSDTINITGDVKLSQAAIDAGLTQGSVTINEFDFLNAPIDRHLEFQVLNPDGTVANNITFGATDYQKLTPIGNYLLSGGNNGAFNLDLTSYNPQVFRAQAATVAQYANQLAINNMVLDHAAIVSGQFLADETANQYAAINPLFAPYQYSKKDGGLWFKSYGNFETISMTQNLNVKNNAYGSLVGMDFPLMNLKNGWKVIPTAYMGYNGAHQTFNGVSMYQNGAQAGVMGTAYKGDFFTSLLAYGGGYANDMNVAGYSDNTGNWFAGVASKTAYNFHLPKDFILQPNALVSYNIFGSQNFGTNFGAMSMNSGFLNGINVAPGLNLIWNKKTFSLYATTQLVFNIMGDVSGKAGNVTLPSVEMRHAYFEYGVGAMKKFKDRFVGYVQISLRNGGRTGVGFQGGIQWRI